MTEQERAERGSRLATGFLLGVFVQLFILDYSADVVIISGIVGLLIIHIVKGLP